jgi:hypothetical protein
MKTYDKRRAPQAEDTTITGAPAILTPGFLRYVGELLFGERWQSPLAERLGAIRGKALSPATVHHWSTATRSIPPWVKDALVELLDRAQRDMRHRAETAESVARRIRGDG